MKLATEFEDMPESDGEQPGASVAMPPSQPLIEFFGREIDASKTLLGNRWLCVEGGALFVGPSGIGKSSASVQQDLLWALGRPAFGIAPTRPLRILTIQAEDDAGDIAEMVTGVVRGLEIPGDELAAIGDRALIVSEKSHTGHTFLQKIVRPLLSEHRPDLLRINPLFAYLGGDVSDAEVTAAFLRTGLNPMLEEFQCGAIINHHTPKVVNRDTANWRGSDWMYSGAGSADITNWMRAGLVIDPTSDEQMFRFIAAKRGRRIGWVDDYGSPTIFRHFCHSSGDAMFWREATPDEIPQSGGTAKTAADLKALVPGTGTIWKTALIDRASAASIGERKARTFLDDLIEAGELFEHYIKRARTNDKIEIGRHPQVLL